MIKPEYRKIATAIFGLVIWASCDVQAALVNISGQLTSFQSAVDDPSRVDPLVGLFNGIPLTLDPAAPKVFYTDQGAIGGNNPYAQSTTEILPPGTQSVQFTYDFDGAGPNHVGFTAAGPSNVSVGDVFKVGTITYTNGQWFPFARIGLQIDVSSDDPLLDGHSFKGNIHVAVSNPPLDAGPEANADFFYLESNGTPLTALGSVRVFDTFAQPPGNPGNSGSVDLYARIGSLIPVRFDNPSSAAFLSKSLQPIPVPGAIWLMGSGLLGLVGIIRRRMTLCCGNEPGRVG